MRLPSDITTFIAAIQRQDQKERGYRVPRGILLAERIRQLPEYVEIMNPDGNGHAPPRKPRKRK